MRVHLINWYEVELAQLDTAGIQAETPAGLPSGYDPDFNEPVVTTSGSTRVDARKEKTPFVRVPCQIEPTTFEALQMFANGDSPDAKVVLCFLFHDLLRLGLVDAATGEGMIRKGDRMNAIYGRCGGPLIQTIRRPPGLFVTQSAFGAGLGHAATTLITTFEDRELGTRTTG